MSQINVDLDKLRAALGYKPLSRGWAKMVILLGLVAVGLGILLGDWIVHQAGVALELAAVALGLFVLGSYLALAGHRSHLYQSANELTAYLAEEFRRMQQKG